jgi:hypothetical protein
MTDSENWPEVDEEIALALFVIAAACTAFCSESETYPVWRKFAETLAAEEPPDQKTLRAAALYLTMIANRYQEKKKNA